MTNVHSTNHLPLNEYRQVNKLQRIKFVDKHAKPQSHPEQEGADTAVVSFQYGSKPDQKVELELDSVDKKAVVSYSSNGHKTTERVWKYEVGHGWIGPEIDGNHPGDLELHVINGTISLSANDNNHLRADVNSYQNTTTVLAGPGGYADEEGTLRATSSINRSSQDQPKKTETYIPGHGHWYNPFTWF